MTSYFDLRRKFTLLGRMKLDHAFRPSLDMVRSTERKLLSEYLRGKIGEPEATYLWPRIMDHKWYLSERLSRDVGFHVAAVDYIENFHRPVLIESAENSITPSLQTIKRGARTAIRFYFESKGRANF